MSIQKKGDDLLLSILILATNKDGINAGLTVKGAVKRLSDGNYWDGSDWSGGEFFNTMLLAADGHGLYNFTLVKGASSRTENYQINYNVTGTEAWDQSINVDIPAELNEIKSQVSQISNSVNSGIRNLSRNQTGMIENLKYIISLIIKWTRRNSRRI